MTANVFRRRSLKTRMTLFSLAVFLLGVWSLAFYVSRMLREDLEQLLGEQQFSTASFIATQVNQELDNRLRALETVAVSAAPALLAGPAAVQELLEQRPVFQALFNAGTFVTGLDGIASASVPTSAQRLGRSYIDRDFMVVALREGKSTIGQPALGKQSLAPVLAMAVPIRDQQGTVIGALVGATDLGESGFLDKIAENRYGRSGSYLLIAPQHKLFVTASDKSLIMQPLPAPGINPMHDKYMEGFEGYGVATSSRGVEELSAAKGIPLAGWFVAVVLPTAEAFAPIRAMRQRMLLTTSILTLLAGMLVWWTSSWILRRQLSPLLAAAQSLDTMPDAGQNLLPLPGGRPDEIGLLIAGFNRLLETLGLRETALRESDERFRALHDASFGGISIHDRGVILDCNQGLSALTGYTREELVGMDGLRLIAPAWRELVMKNIQDGAVQACEVEGLRKDGSRYQLCIRAKNIPYKGRTVRVTELRDISRRKAAEAVLRESEARFRVLFEQAAIGVAQIGSDDGRFVRVNQRYCDLLGYSQAEMLALSLHAMTHPDDRASDVEHMQRLVAGELREFSLEKRYFRKDGSITWVLLTVSSMWAPGDKPDFHIAVVQDITARKQAEEQLHFAASVFTHAREGIMITAADGSIIDVNAAFTNITGYERDEALGRNPRLLSSGRQEKAFYASLWSDLTDKGYWCGEVWNRRKNGDLYMVMQTISAVRDAQGKTRHYVALFSDITALKESQKRLEHIAHYDMLTTLPNRVLLADRLHQAMASAQRRGQRLAVAYLDLDGFKAINDSHGHEAGDQLLMTVAARMKLALREGDTLARLGGDEFVAVLLDLPDIAASVSLLNRMLAAAAQPVHVGDLVLQVSASLGVTFYPQAEDVEADQLLRQADQVMYQAKLTGKNRYQVFDADLDRSVRGHHEGLENIRRALGAREFVLHYQPKINMRSGQVIGAEALIRWQHPQKGLLLPAVFLPVIEDHLLAVEVGEWVIDTALSQMALWQAGGLNIPVSVNVGARQLQQPDFAERLRVILAAHPEVRPGDLELEVLETSALEDLSHVSRVIEACREIGVNFALDDFGTGYSSLTYLKRLPVTQLKIDKSFVRDMLDDPDDLAILEGVLGLATAFRRQVIVEGVETGEQEEMLLHLGCELIQGFSIALPMPAGELADWSAAWQPDESWSSRTSICRDDLPLLFASAEHRAWIAILEKYFNGECAVPPMLDHHQCRFGIWMDSLARARHVAHPALQAIEPLHRQVHALAAELCALKANGQDAEVQSRLGELDDLRDALLEQLKVLVRESSGPSVE